MNNELYLEFQRYLGLLLRRKRLLVLVTLLVMTLGVVVSYLLPKKFEAQSTVFIEQSVISDLVKGIAINPSMDAKIKVLSVSMLSRENLTRVLRILDKDLDLTTDAKREAYLDALRTRIKITLDEKRGIVFLSFVDPDPRFARDLINTMAQVYIESNTASKRDESLDATRFLSEQIDSFKKRIDVVEEEINQYKANHGLQLAVDETIIRFEIADAEKKLEGIRARRFQLETQDRLLPTGGGQRSPVADLEQQLAGLLTTYTESHPRVVRLRAEIDAMKASPSRGRAGDGGAGLTRALLQAELEANKGFEEAQLRAIEENRQLLREIPSIRTGLNELLRKKENETLIYSQLVTRYGQSEVSKQMEMENKSMTFRIVDPAVLPTKHISPKRLLIMFGALAVGLGAGAALIILPYLMGGAVKSPDELRALNLRVLAVLPAIPKPDEDRQRRKGDLIFLGLAALYFSALMAVVAIEALGKPYMEAALNQVKAYWF
ncbi:MAG: GNVR domain-containing protein [Desulfomicrobium sp.]|nr:GNVR domain-containing protein [Desulfomicrobium sp.]